MFQALNSLGTGTRFALKKIAKRLTVVFEAKRKFSMVRLSDYDCIGFDLDHTIIQYRLSNLFPLIHRILAEFMVEKKGYESSLLTDDYNVLKGFCLRGLVFDAEKGNILKLSGNGYILRASHGTRHLSGSEIENAYGDKRIWPVFHSMKSCIMTVSDRYRFFETFFDVPLIALVARAVDVTDKKEKNLPSYIKIFKDVIDGVVEQFRPDVFAAGTGNYFPTLREETAKYVKPCAKELIQWLSSLRNDGKQVFLLTNSFIDYTSLLMEFAVGKEWKNLFNVVVCLGKKPAFFQSSRDGNQAPFYIIENDKETQPTNVVEENKTYSQGNYEDFVCFLSRVTRKPKPKVLYFGDSIKADIYPVHEFTTWDVVSVLEEMECEGMVAIDWVKHEEWEDGPKRKKTKYFEVDVEEGKEDVLMSNQWGSLFTDLETNLTPDEEENSNSTGNPHTLGRKTKIVQLKVDARKEDIILSELNTFWGELVRKCSTIAIPKLDFITGLPRDHEFMTFSTHHHGFYPGIPKSLHIP